MNFRRNIILSRFFSLQSEKRFSPRPAPVISDRHMQKYLPHTRVSADRQSFPELHREESESIRPASFPSPSFLRFPPLRATPKTPFPRPYVYYTTSLPICQPPGSKKRRGISVPDGRFQPQTGSLRYRINAGKFLPGIYLFFIEFSYSPEDFFIPGVRYAEISASAGAIASYTAKYGGNPIFFIMSSYPPPSGPSCINSK